MKKRSKKPTINELIESNRKLEEKFDNTLNAIVKNKKEAAILAYHDKRDPQWAYRRPFDALNAIDRRDAEIEISRVGINEFIRINDLKI